MTAKCRELEANITSFNLLYIFEQLK